MRPLKLMIAVINKACLSVSFKQLLLPLAPQLPIQMIPGMPLELYEEIIDAVGAWPVTEDDHNPDREFTLRSCTLVCRAWRSRAQHQLFRHIELTDEASMKRLVTLFDDAPQLETDVKSLRIRSSNLYHPRDVFVLAPVELWGRLPSLTSLFVSHLGIDTHDVDPDSSIKRGHTLPLHPHLPIVFSAFRNVVELTLWGTKFGNFSDCARVLDGFQNLHTLTIRSVQSFLSQEGSDYESETCSRGRPFLDKLRCLHVSPPFLNVSPISNMKDRSNPHVTLAYKHCCPRCVPTSSQPSVSR